MKKQIQYLLVGYPFSGKTVLAKELEKRCGFVRLSIDDVKFDFGYEGISDNEVPDEVWEKIFLTLDRKIIEQLQKGKTILCEYAWLTKEWRKRAKNLADSLGIETKIIFVRTSEKLVKERWQHNKKTKERFDIPNDVFEESMKLFEIPTSEENSIVFNPEDNVEDWIQKYILS